MKIKIDVYYRNPKDNNFKIFQDEITEEDIAELMKKKHDESLPMWMDENWRFDSISVDEIKM